MTSNRLLALLGITALLLTGCATKISTDKNAPTTPVSATLTLTETQAAYWASAKGGSGILTFEGETHPFKVYGIGAGGTGLQRISATGTVYNLYSLEAFEGSYRGVRSGITLIKGKMHARLKNDKGVILYLVGKTTGLSTSMGFDRFIVKFE